MKAPPVSSIASSVLAQSAWKRVLLAVSLLVLLWLAIVWAVAIP
ncbi:MAG: hypothetical protein ACOH2R_11140 [Pseudomonas sp.]